MNDLLSLTDQEFQQIRDLVYSWFGINLTDQKRALVVGRLNRVLRDLKFDTFQEYYDYIVKDDTGHALSVLVDRISTNHTFFYREHDHFDFLRDDILPGMIEEQRRRGKKELRFWIAGCSSGEESYMIAMIVRDLLGSELSSWEVGLLATDISTIALEKAEKGVYTAENVEHLPVEYKRRYMSKQKDGSWQVQESLKSMITHRRLNLMRTSFPFKRQFHIIFCRNVMIYFDRQTREGLVERFHRYTVPEGYLFIGHSETLGRHNDLYRYIKPAIYRRMDG